MKVAAFTIGCYFKKTVLGFAFDKREDLSRVITPYGGILLGREMKYMLLFIFIYYNLVILNYPPPFLVIFLKPSFFLAHNSQISGAQEGFERVLQVLSAHNNSGLAHQQKKDGE